LVDEAVMDKTKMAVAVFDKYAKQYQAKYMIIDHYKDSINQFCKLIPQKNASILELACGPGNCTRYLIEQRPDFKILGTDLAPNMIELAKKNNITAHFELLDCRHMTTLEKKFDAIFCGFCLPYLSKDETLQLIKDASLLLNPNGVLYLSTMEDDYQKSGFKKGSSGDLIYMYYHEGDYLTKALEENLFSIKYLKRQEYSPNGVIESVDLLLIAQL
jgi:ubiquinone/menaquinone biosynthesis C-methylase UbiE